MLSNPSAVDNSIATIRHFYAKYVAEGARMSKDRIRMAFAAVENHPTLANRLCRRVFCRRQLRALRGRL